MDTTIVKGGEFSPDQIALLKTTVAKGCSDDELKLFLHVCQRSGLDPFARQIYAIKRKNRRTNTEEMTIQTGIDGYRVIAERTGKYAPGPEPKYNYDKEGRLISATSSVFKLVGDRWFEVSATAFFVEYVQEGNQLWGKLPHVMLSKVAESLCLRRAFPNELSGVYTHEEMAQAESGAIKMPEKKTAQPPVLSQAPETPIEMEGPLIFSPISEEPSVQEAIPFPPLKEAPEMPFAAMKIDRPKQRALFALMKECGLVENQLRAVLKDLFGLEHTGELTRGQYEQLVSAMKRGRGVQEE